MRKHLLLLIMVLIIALSSSCSEETRNIRYYGTSYADGVNSYIDYTLNPHLSLDYRCIPDEETALAIADIVVAPLMEQLGREDYTDVGIGYASYYDTWMVEYDLPPNPDGSYYRKWVRVVLDAQTGEVVMIWTEMPPDIMNERYGTNYGVKE